ncbi:MAG: hypothetical protein ACR2P3_08535 [Geminicoccaceae bacterium]
MIDPLKAKVQALCAFFLVGSIAIAAPIESALASSFCSDVNHLIENVHASFSEIIVEPGRASGGYDVTLKLDGAFDCAVTPRINKKSYYCTWKFQYRAANAYTTFKKLDLELKECIGDRAVLHKDQSVNHPDFYDSRIFQLDQAKITVSVKDKGALGNTFIFIWVEPGSGA